MTWGIDPKNVKWHDKWAQHKAEHLPCYLGARLIFKGEDKFEVVTDRLGIFGETSGDVKEGNELYTWLGKIGWSELRNLLKREHLSISDDRDIRVETLDGHYIIASPKASHGYLHVSFWKVPDVSFPENF